MGDRKNFPLSGIQESGIVGRLNTTLFKTGTVLRQFGGEREVYLTPP